MSKKNKKISLTLSKLTALSIQKPERKEKVWLVKQNQITLHWKIWRKPFWISKLQLHKLCKERRDWCKFTKIKLIRMSIWLRCGARKNWNWWYLVFAGKWSKLFICFAIKILSKTMSSFNNCSPALSNSFKTRQRTHEFQFMMHLLAMQVNQIKIKTTIFL